MLFKKDHVTLDLLDMSIIARLNENPRSVLISTEMVRSITLPVEGFDFGKLRKWFYNQRYYREIVNQEILELIMVNKFINADPDRIPLEDQFWRLSDPCMAALNNLASWHMLLKLNYKCSKEPAKLERKRI